MKAALRPTMIPEFVHFCVMRGATRTQIHEFLTDLRFEPRQIDHWIRREFGERDFEELSGEISMDLETHDWNTKPNTLPSGPLAPRPSFSRKHTPVELCTPEWMHKALPDQDRRSIDVFRPRKYKPKFRKEKKIHSPLKRVTQILALLALILPMNISIFSQRGNWSSDSSKKLASFSKNKGPLRNGAALELK